MPVRTWFLPRNAFEIYGTTYQSSINYRKKNIIIFWNAYTKSDRFMLVNNLIEDWDTIVLTIVWYLC